MGEVRYHGVERSNAVRGGSLVSAYRQLGVGVPPQGRHLRK